MAKRRIKRSYSRRPTFTVRTLGHVRAHLGRCPGCKATILVVCEKSS